MCGILYLHDPSKKIPGLVMAKRAFMALAMQQHRGYQGGGVGYVAGVQGDRKRVWLDKFFGPVSSQYDTHGAKKSPPEPFCDGLGKMVHRNPYKVIGHGRYATAGPADDLIHYQPNFVEDIIDGRVIYAANGDIPRLDFYREALEEVADDVPSQNDGDFTLRQIAYYRRKEGLSWVAAMQRFMQEIPGAYSGILMTKKRTFFMRDPHGIRPFLVGRTEDGMIVAASESCVFPILKASLIFEVERGSIVEITDDGTMTVHAYPGVLPKHSAHCVVCLAYFARPDSHVFIDGKNPADVHQKGSYAYRFGVELAVEHPVKADFVASIRNSGDLATKGYSKRSGLPDKELLIRNFSIPRTFLASEQEEREFMVMLKFGLMTDMFRDADMRRVCLIDDTIIRATTMRGIVSLLRAGGAEEVHIRTAFPPITNPCFMGIAMPTRAELVASSRTIEEIKDFIQADSLGYLSIDGLSRAMVERNDSLQNYCTACFTGHYPIPVTA